MVYSLCLKSGLRCGYPVNDLVEGNFGKNKHSKSYLQDPEVLQSAQEPETCLVTKKQVN